MNMYEVFLKKQSRSQTKITRENLWGFTLVELLIVIGILAVLTAAIVLVLNPADLLRQSRDTKRTQDLALINSSISLLLTQDPSVSLGTNNTVYVSISDTTTTCANLGLPQLPSGYVYGCVSSSTLRNVDGTGWIPIDFTRNTLQNISSLPVDPQNTTTTGQYYRYVAVSGKFELGSRLESKKQKIIADSDGGLLSDMYEIGTSMSLMPLQAIGSSCADIKNKDANAISGFYAIQIGANIQRVYCDMIGNGGGWTLVDNSFIQNIQDSYTVNTTSTNAYGGIIINVQATGTPGCSPERINKIYLLDIVSWTKIRYTQDFYGDASCWGIFGSSGFTSGGSNLIEFSLSQDIIQNQVKMNNSTSDVYDGLNSRCDNESVNFWHGMNGQGLRSAEVVLRRNSTSTVAGLSTGVTCNSGSTRWIYKNIYIK